MRQKLEYQADRIEAVLAVHKIAARVTGGTVTPRWVSFQVLPALGAKISRIKGLSEELAAALDASSCRVSRRGAAVTVEVPRDDPRPVRLLPLYHQLMSGDSPSPTPPITAILGLADDGVPLLIRLPSPDVAHILVAGTTGSGKTMLMQAMILSLALMNANANPNPVPSPPLKSWGESARVALGGTGLALVLIDPKGHAFGHFEGLPHLARPVIRESAEAAEALNSLVRLMERRHPTPVPGSVSIRAPTARPRRGQADQRASHAPAETWRGETDREARPRQWEPWHVVVMIDELADLLMTGGKPVQRALTRLTQRGREAGIHVVAATQKPTAAVLGPLVKANFPVRLVGRVTSIEDARTASGWSGTGAERLLGRGDFLAVAEGRVTRFQAAHVSPQEIRETATCLAQGRTAAAPVVSRPRLPWPVRLLTDA